MANSGDDTYKFKDQIASFEGGIDAGRSPSDLEPNQSALTLNASVRNGFLHPRPGYTRHLLTFPNSGVQSAFQYAWFQEGAFFDGTGVPCLISSHGGRQFRVDIASWQVTEITATSGYAVELISPFTIPAVGSTVAVTVSDVGRFTLTYPLVTIGGLPFTLTALGPGANQITVQNNANTPTQTVGETTTAVNFTVPAVGATVTVHLDSTAGISPGAIVINGLNFICTQVLNTTKILAENPGATAQTTITAPFTVPAVGTNVTLPVASAALISATLPDLELNGIPLIVVSNIAGTVTVKNLIAANALVVVASGKPVTFMYDACIAGNTVTSGSLVTFATSVTFTSLDLNSPTIQQNWSCAPEQWFLLQDNQAACFVYDGATSYRAQQSKWQVPTGNVMWYAQGRLGVALPDNRTYVVGDAVFDPSGTPLYNYRDAVLYFTENNYLNEGGDFVARVFGAPSDAGDIMAACAAAQTDTSLGEGSILVGTPSVIFSLNLPFDRTTWKNTTNPLQTASPIQGPLSPWCFFNVNSDAWYRANDGIRSWVLAQRQFNGSYGNVSMSAEVDTYLDADSTQWLSWASGCCFDSRALVTCSPQSSPAGIYWRGLLALDFEPVQGRRKAPPAWESVWSGLRILKIIACKVNHLDRCFMWCVGNNNDIQIWELTFDDTQRWDFDGTDQMPIVYSVDSRSFACGDRDRAKKLETVRAKIANLKGQLNWSALFKSNEYPCWVPWASGTLCAVGQDCRSFATAVGVTVVNSFVVPLLNGTVALPVATGTVTACPPGSWVTVGGYSFVVVSNNLSLVVQNLIPYAGNGTAVVAPGATVYLSTCQTPVEYQPQTRWLRLPTPPDGVPAGLGGSPTQGVPCRVGYEFQVRLQFSGVPGTYPPGSCDLSQLRIYCSDVDELLGMDQQGGT